MSLLEDPGVPYRINCETGPTIVCATLEETVATLIKGGMLVDEAYVLCAELAYHYRGFAGAFDWLILEGISAAQALIYLLEVAMRPPLEVKPCPS